jgi:hypothetical protein
MNKHNLAKKIAFIAAELDNKGFIQEAEKLDSVLLKIAQVARDPNNERRDGNVTMEQLSNGAVKIKDGDGKQLSFIPASEVKHQLKYIKDLTGQTPKVDPNPAKATSPPASLAPSNLGPIVTNKPATNLGPNITPAKPSQAPVAQPASASQAPVAQPASATQQLSSKPRERSDSNQIVVPFRDIDQIIGKLQGQAKVDFEKSLIYTDINNAKGLVQTTDTAFNKAQEAINPQPPTRLAPDETKTQMIYLNDAQKNQITNQLKPIDKESFEVNLSKDIKTNKWYMSKELFDSRFGYTNQNPKTPKVGLPPRGSASSETELDNFILQNKNQTIRTMYNAATNKKGPAWANQLISYYKRNHTYTNADELVK